MRFGTEPLKEYKKKAILTLVLSGVFAGALLLTFLFRKEGPSPSQRKDNPSPIARQEMKIPEIGELSPAAETAAKSKRTSIIEFQRVAEEALQILPKKRDVGDMRQEEVHQTPSIFVQKIQPLIKINRIVRENPELKGAAFTFYKTCAVREDFMTAVRARCLNHLRKLATESGQSLDLSPFPEAVRKLSEFIPF